MTAGRSRLLPLAASLVLVGAPLQAQTDEELRRAALGPTIEALTKGRSDRTSFPDLVDQVLDDYGKFVLAAAVTTENGRFIVEANRIDKQVGAGSRGSGSTNLVTSGSVPRLLGFALETGAITQAVSGSSVTFQTNPAGLVHTLMKGAAALRTPAGDPATQNTLNVLRRFNVGLTFDADQDSEQGFTGSYRQLQQLSVQVYLYNRRDPTHPAWASLWRDFAAHAGNALPNVISRLALDLHARAGYKTLRAETRQRLLDAATDQEIEEAIAAHAEGLQAFVSDRVAARLLDEWAAYLRAQSAVYRGIARSQILTVEYQLDRPPAQDAPADASAETPAALAPDLSTFRLVWVRPFLGSSDMTVNGSFSAFNAEVAGTDGSIRDWQIGGKLDFPLNGVLGVAKSQFTLAALYMRLRQSPLGVPVTVNGVPVDRTGGIKFLQARLRIPLADSGFSVPISFTYASRTELIADESQVRGNLGLTLDLDKLLGARSLGR